MAKAAVVATIIQETVDAAGKILPIVTALDPGVAVPADIAAEIAILAAKALAAWSAAAETPITIESIQALLPNPAPLTPPTS